MINIKSKREIELMRKAGSIVALTHQKVREFIKPGITTNQIDQLVEKVILENDAIPSFKDYQGFPGSACISVNEEVVHGIPADRVLKEGDIVSVDIGAKYKGYHGDSAWTYPVGTIDQEKARLLTKTEEALMAGLNEVREGVHLTDVSHAIEQVAKINNLGIVRELAGHGVGQELHESPEILNYTTKSKGPVLKNGMTLAIEPMLNLGTEKIKFLSDGWTTLTKDKKASAHFEHTILVTKDGYEILTKLQEEANETRSN